MIRTSGIHVLQGSLYHADEARHEPQCVCGANEGVGTVPCKDVEKRSDCNDGNWQIRVPYGFFKTVIDPSANASWSFVYTKAQRETGPQIKCDGVCQTPQQAFLEGRKNVAAALAAPALFHNWEAVEEIAATKCDWCADFNATEWREMGPLHAEAEAPALKT